MDYEDHLDELLSEADLAVHEHQIRKQSSKYSIKTANVSINSQKHLLSSTCNGNQYENGTKMQLENSQLSSVLNESVYFDTSKYVTIPPINLIDTNNTDINPTPDLQRNGKNCL